MTVDHVSDLGGPGHLTDRDLAYGWAIAAHVAIERVHHLEALLATIPATEVTHRRMIVAIRSEIEASGLLDGTGWEPRVVYEHPNVVEASWERSDHGEGWLTIEAPGHGLNTTDKYLISGAWNLADTADAPYTEVAVLSGETATEALVNAIIYVSES